MDQRAANREAKRAALFLLPVDPPLPDDVDVGGLDADRLRTAWGRMRDQLEREGKAAAPAARDDPDQLAAFTLAEVRGPLCGEHDAPIAQVEWDRDPDAEGAPRWRRIQFTCGCLAQCRLDR